MLSGALYCPSVVKMGITERRAAVFPLIEIIFCTNGRNRIRHGTFLPDTELEPLGDATFLFYKDGKVISALEGMTEDNIRTDKSFQKVEACDTVRPVEFHIY